jgi:hypothetical protein
MDGGWGIGDGRWEMEVDIGYWILDIGDWRLGIRD